MKLYDTFVEVIDELWTRCKENNTNSCSITLTTKENKSLKINMSFNIDSNLGHWIPSSLGFYKCSRCNSLWDFYLVKNANYCPNCGCRMIEPQESEVQE